MISTIILAAGQSKRMGQPKMLLPWGQLTVIEQVITTFLSAGVEDIVVVTGGVREQVRKVIEQYPVREIHNSDYASGEMLSSLQAALRSMPPQVEATLIGLGDQPQVEEESVRFICERYREKHSQIIVPSFQMKRGNPWLLAQPLWKDILELKPPESPRNFLNRHASDIYYVNVNTPSILADLDTPEDYRNARAQRNFL
jgi:molybdenum cofactor cytidylyltransferase